MRTFVKSWITEPFQKHVARLLGEFDDLLLPLDDDVVAGTVED